MKLIVSAHGMLAKEVVNSAGMVFGAIDDLDIVTFVPGENEVLIMQHLRP